MRTSRKRLVALVVLSSGMLLASTCDAVWQTIQLALNIVNVWV